MYILISYTIIYLYGIIYTYVGVCVYTNELEQLKLVNYIKKNDIKFHLNL